MWLLRNDATLHLHTKYFEIFQSSLNRSKLHSNGSVRPLAYPSSNLYSYLMLFMEVISVFVPRQNALQELVYRKSGWRLFSIYSIENQRPIRACMPPCRLMHFLPVFITSFTFIKDFVRRRSLYRNEFLKKDVCLFTTLLIGNRHSKCMHCHTYHLEHFLPVFYTLIVFIDVFASRRFLYKNIFTKDVNCRISKFHFEIEQFRCILRHADVPKQTNAFLTNN